MPAGLITLLALFAVTRRPTREVYIDTREAAVPDLLRYAVVVRCPCPTQSSAAGLL